MQWWTRNNLRLMQNNLMETDAGLDVDRLIANLKDFSINTLMLNTGGIVAFYPTELEFHRRSPSLTGDLIGEAVKKCHENGIRFIARFDFSKADVSVCARRPEWFFTSADGRHIEYNGTALTCVNGGYQREYSHRILGEVMDRYDIDGVFFNMFGYQNWDYSGNYYGICHCEGCRSRFRQMYGRELPEAEDPADPAYREYVQFKHRTVREQLEGIHRLIKGRNPAIAISTYDEYMVDIVRKESNTELTRPYPFWLYSASENVKSLEDSWGNKLVSNCCINAAGLDYRFMGVSRHQVAARLYESIASGSGLDFCIIGNFDSYPDKDNFETAKAVFRFHKEHEQHFGDLRSLAQIALVKPGRGAPEEARKEYLGLFRMLKEAHLLFDVTHGENLAEALGGRGYRAILVPEIETLDGEGLQRLSQAHAGGAALLATVRSAERAAGCGAALRSLFGVDGFESVAPVRSSYLSVEEHGVFASFPRDKWVLLAGGFTAVRPGAGVRGLLPHVSAGRFGPPEKCGGHGHTGLFGATVREGPAPAVLLPWEPGRLYHDHGYEEHKRIVLDLLRHALPGPQPLETDAPAAVEVFFDRSGQGGHLLQLINLSGFNGTTFLEPLPIHGISVTLWGLPPTVRATSLTGQEFSLSTENDGIRIHIDRLGQYEAIALE